MSSLKVLRHEFKYTIDKNIMYKIRDELKEVMPVDRSIDGYKVRSLYFDSLDDDDYYAKLDGDMVRKKIRIRIYDINSSVIKLEMKSKKDIHQTKESLIIDRETCGELINGNYDVLLNYNDDIAKEIYLILRQRYYVPKSIIEYERLAFVSPNNTRITMDYEIKTYPFVENQFFSEEVDYQDVTDKNQVVLEVKFDHFLEEYIAKILDKYIASNVSVSKYVMGRNKEV